MTRTIVLGVTAIGVGVFLLSPLVLARKNDDQGFPDYNHLEFAKPKPPADQQVPEAPRGGIPLRVDMSHPSTDLPPDALSAPPARPAQVVNESEPPMDGFIDTLTVKKSSAGVSGSTVPVQ